MITWFAQKYTHIQALQSFSRATIYALRNMVERCFNKLKNARRLSTRYDKTAESYLGFIHIVSIRL